LCIKNLYKVKKEWGKLIFLSSERLKEKPPKNLKNIEFTGFFGGFSKILL